MLLGAMPSCSQKATDSSSPPPAPTQQDFPPPPPLANSPTSPSSPAAPLVPPGGSTPPSVGSAPSLQSDNSGLDLCAGAEGDLCSHELEIAKLTNEFRRRQGLRELRIDPSLNLASRLWSMAQARNGYIGHERFEQGGHSPALAAMKSKFPKVNADVSISGENVAYSTSPSDPSTLAPLFTNMWIDSWGHRQNMLGDFTTIGIGLATLGGDATYATQIFGSD